MSDKPKQQLPSVLMVNLQNGKRVRYKLTLLRIYNKDGLGRPKEGVFIHDEEEVILEGNEVFVTAYVQDGLDYTNYDKLPLFDPIV